MSDDSNVTEFPGTHAITDEEREKPGSYTARLVEDAKKRLGIDIRKVEPPAELKAAILAKKPNVEFSEEVSAEICTRLLMGETMASICSDRHMPARENVWRWQKKFPEFDQKLAEAKREGSHYIADDCIRIADDESIDPAHKRIMVDTRLRLIKSWHNKAYGDNVKLSGDENGSPVRFFIDGLSDRVKAGDDAVVIEQKIEK